MKSMGLTHNMLTDTREGIMTPRAVILTFVSEQTAHRRCRLTASACCRLTCARY